MLQNNNKDIIKRLSNRSLKVNKMRNIFAILAIALTTLLITTTVAGGITFYKTNKTYMNVSTYGTDADGFININGDNEDKLNNIENIKSKGIVQLASTDAIKNDLLAKDRVSLEVAQNQTAYDMMAIVPIAGAYPKQAEDILLPTWALDVLDIEKKIGEKITLDIVINNEVKSIDLNLCGYYEAIVTRGVGRSRAFVSNEFIAKYNSEITKIDGTKTAFVTLKNVKSNSTIETVQGELDKIAKEIGSEKAKAHPKYEEGKVTVDGGLLQQILAVAIGIALVIATGYLIIYNIFYISVTKDIKFYGLLKTVGTTSKQLKRIIIMQGLKLSIIGIPVGLVLGYAVAYFILPIALSFTVFGNIVVVSTNPIIFILSILFSLITVLISCNKPGKIAGKVSPIEAVRFVGSDVENSKKKNKKGTNGAKLNKMAWSNILKNKKRVILSVLSISLSATIVIFTVSATLGINPELHADKQMVADASINNNIGHFWGEKEYEPITEELISKIKALDVVDEIRKNYSAIVPNEDGSIFDFGVEIALEGKIKEEFEIGQSGGKQNFRYSMLDLAKNSMKSQLVALDSDRLEKEVERLAVIDGKIDSNEFKKGNYIIYYPASGEANVIKSGDIIPLELTTLDENGNLKKVKKEFKVMAIVAYKDGNFAASNLAELNIEENAFKEIFPNYEKSISSINIDLKDDVDIEAADKELNKIINESGNTMLGLSSKNFYIEGMKEMQTILIIVGGIIALILGFIGAINVTNTMITSMISRKIEFAMLESIGMTKSQIKKMILFEGMYYILLTTLIVIPLGFIASFVAPMVMPIYGGFNFIVYLLAVIISVLIIAILMLVVPLIGYRSISKDSIVERLRTIE